MKIMMQTVREGDVVSIVFSLPSEAQAEPLVLHVSDYASGAKMKEAALAWAAPHGGKF